MNVSYIKSLSSWVFHVFVHGSDIRLSFSKLPLIRIHIIWPTKLIYAKQEESFWHDYVFLRIDLDCLWTISSSIKKMKPMLFTRAQGWYISYFYWRRIWYQLKINSLNLKSCKTIHDEFNWIEHDFFWMNKITKYFDVYWIKWEKLAIMVMSRVFYYPMLYLEDSFNYKSIKNRDIH